MIDTSKLKRKSKADNYIGTRIDEATKLNLENYCRKDGIAVSVLIVALVKEFLRSKGYTDKKGA